MSEEIKVPLEFKNDGFQLKQVYRDGDLAIYTQSKFGRVIAWEMVKIIHELPKRMPNGEMSKAHEVYPRASQWGRMAWSCPTLARAMERLQVLRDSVRIGTKPPESDGGSPQSLA